MQIDDYSVRCERVDLLEDVSGLGGQDKRLGIVVVMVI